jgi:hypothetical protein
MEIWKPVLGFEEFYEVSFDGKVRSFARQNSRNKKWMGGAIVAPILGSRGYYVVNLTSPGKRKQIFLHKVVLEAFKGVRPDGLEACHNDGNRLNCNVGNLRWDTRSGNHQDKKLHGTWQVGERANNVKLTSEVVLSIRRLGLSPKQAVQQYGLSLTNAKRIINRESWRHLNAE